MLYRSLLAFSTIATVFCEVRPTDNGTILAVFILHNGCDRTSTTPSPDQNSLSAGQLTALGALNCYNSGEWYSNHYLNAVSQRLIYGMSQIYDPNTVNAMVAASNTNYYTQSGMAFLQGLFPPTNYLIEPLSNITGTVTAPLDGYQYAVLDIYSQDDPASIFVDGAAQCTGQMLSENSYYASTDFFGLLNLTDAFYKGLYDPYLQGVFDYNDCNFYHAYQIYDYVNINYEGNTTLINIPQEDLDTLYAHATTLIFNSNANLTTSPEPNWESLVTANDGLRDIAARSLSRKIISSLQINIASSNTINKFNFILADVPIFLSLFAIANLTSVDPIFLQMPVPGASLSFEVHTLGNASEATTFDTSTQDLYVRFQFRNGSGSEPMVPYPLFNADGPIMLPWDDFSTRMNQISLLGTNDWCTLCVSPASFCTQEVFLNVTYTDGTPVVSNSSHSVKSTVSPAVAGVIGAIVTLVLTGILGALAFCCFGVAITRHNRRRSSLAGIKTLGRSQKPEKVGSDMELALSPRASAMGTSQFDHYDNLEDSGKFGTGSSADTAVGVQTPGEAHLKLKDYI